MIKTTIDYVPGKRVVEHYGIVSGSTVRAKNVFKDFGQSFKNMLGGELKTYTQLLNQSREEAVERMCQQAERMGANAVINIRFISAEIAAGAAEMCAYGTAVRVE